MTGHVLHSCDVLYERYPRQKDSKQTEKEDQGRRQTENKVGLCFVTEVDPAMSIVRLYSYRAQWLHIGHIGVSLVKQSPTDNAQNKKGCMDLIYGFYIVSATQCRCQNNPSVSTFIDKDFVQKVQKLKRKFPVEKKYVYFKHVSILLKYRINH